MTYEELIADMFKDFGPEMLDDGEKFKYDMTLRALRIAAIIEDGAYKVMSEFLTEDQLNTSYRYERDVCGGSAHGLNHSSVYASLYAAAPPLPTLLGDEKEG